jgi:hypothetical protein
LCLLLCIYLPAALSLANTTILYAEDRLSGIE